MNLSETTLIRDTTVVSLKNETIIWSSQVSCFSVDNGRIYFSDYHSGKLIIADEQLNYQTSIGNRGKGPGEFVGIDKIFIVGDILYILDSGSMSINIFKDNKYIRQIAIPTGIAPWARFFAKDSLFYMPALGEAPIVCFDHKSSIKNRIGEFISHDDNASRILLLGRNSFYSIGISVPVVEEYTFEGEKIQEYNLFQIPIIKEKYNELSSKLRNAGSFFTFVRDASYDGHNVYLLISDLVLSLGTEKEIMPKSISKLNKDYVYSKLCVDQNKVFLFNMTSAEIEVYHFYNKHFD